jgi:prepilin-type N-terminal cleavage/methylation domain-containing protein
MRTRWANSRNSGFTVIELIIVIVIIGILAAISIIAYSGVQKTAADKAMKSDLQQVSAEMQRAELTNNGVYPTTLPSTIKASPHISLALKSSGTINYYSGGLTAVQNGVLMAQICQDLINEGVGKGVNGGGTTVAFITGCGNWVHNSMQITGWDSQVYSTPLTDTTLLNYSNNFTTNDTYNKDEERVIKNFYNQLVWRQTQEGGSYPITSFWDSWATPQNDGVPIQALPTGQKKATYCVEATHDTYSDLRWHMTQDLKLLVGGC